MFAFSPPPAVMQSEPRNYAPRTAGFSGPPPKFCLDAAVMQRSQPSASDPILSSSEPAEEQQNQLTIVPADHMRHKSLTGQETRSEQLQKLLDTPSGLPTARMAMDPANLPFIENAKQSKSVNHGIVRLRNIPFAAPQAEIVAVFGRTSRILNDSEEPVHIIMERMTGKTMDAYVEFYTLEDAMRAVEKVHRNVKEGRPCHIGQRTVSFSLASQADLMQDLFPVATGVTWNGASPEIDPPNYQEPWKNFKGFVSEEEMVMLAKHAKVPSRTPFSRSCPQRPYECLISTLKKFPWHLTDHITISQRYAIFRTTWELVEELVHRLQREYEDPPSNVNGNRLTQQLLDRLIATALRCPGFTPLMKADIASFTNLSEDQMIQYGMPRSGERWAHQYAIAPRPGTPFDIIEWYIGIIHTQTNNEIMSRPFSERSRFQEAETDSYWGFFWLAVDFPQGQQFDDMSLAQAAAMEFNAIERILHAALPAH